MLASLLALPLVLTPQGVAPTAITQTAYLKHAAPDKDDRFGFDVGASGQRVIVGSPEEDSAATGVDGDWTDDSLPFSGCATIFELQGGAWVQAAYLKAPVPHAHDFFGYSVAIDGDLAVVGAYGDGLGGAIHVYRFDGVAWQHEARLEAHVPGGGDRFGASVDLSDGRIVVGAPYEDGSGTGVNPSVDEAASNAGAAYVFEHDGSAWNQTAYLKASNPDFADTFGRVAIDGDLIAVAADSEDSAATGIDGDQADDSLSGAGAVYTFRFVGGSWQPEAYLKPSFAPGGSSGFGFGGSLDVDGDTLVVGAAFEDGTATGVDGDQAAQGGEATGAAYVFEHDAATGWAQTAYLKSLAPDDQDWYGHDVCVSGDLIAVGASGEDGGSAGVGGDPTDDSVAGSGAVFVYRRVGSTWTTDAYLKSSSPGVGDEFGGGIYSDFGSLAMDRNLLVVGAYGEDSASGGIDGDELDDTAWQSGAAYAFDMGLPCRVTSYGPGAPAHPVVLSSADEPRVGAAMDLDVLHGTTTGTALLALAAAPASVPHFGGTLLLDWPTVLLSPPGFVTVPLTGGSGTKQLSLPTGTTGVTFYAQVAVLDAAQPSGLALSNGLAITICP